MKIRVFTAFSGYDSQCLALERLRQDVADFDYELVGWSEVDRNAIAAHNALFPQWADRNFGDMQSIDWSRVPDFDFFTYSTPCQDFSRAGLQRGGEEGSGTQSSLLWQCRRAIEAKRPKYLFLENVKTLIGSKFMPLFQRWLAVLEGYGYSNFWKVIDAADYGIPQHRERLFCFSVHDLEAHYTFPSPIPLQTCLADVLDNEVDNSYYIDPSATEAFVKANADAIRRGC